MSIHRTVPRILVGLVGVATTVGPLTADFLVPATARMHIRNPRWPAHAKFHNAQYIVMSAVLGAVGLRLVAGPQDQENRRLLTAASILSAPWVGMWGATAFPGTALVDPEFADQPGGTIAGVEANLAVGTICLGVLAAAAGLARRPW